MPGVGVDAPAEQQAGVGGVEGVVPPVLGQAGQLARGVGGGAEHLHRAPRTPATRHQDGCSRIEIFGETMIDDSCLPSSLDVEQCSRGRSESIPKIIILTKLLLFEKCWIVFSVHKVLSLLLTSRGYVNEGSKLT